MGRVDRKLWSFPRTTLSCLGLQQKRKEMEGEEHHRQTGGAAQVQLPDSAVAGSEHPAVLE